nr:uncharacterized protein LOC126056099 [Helicoverpa armigera]
MLTIVNTNLTYSCVSSVSALANVTCIVNRVLCIQNWNKIIRIIDHKMSNIFIMFISGSVLSTVCVIVLLTTWCLLPKWRTLQNYISVNQVITGTVYLCGEITIAYYLHWKTITFVLNIFLLASVSWSLCASLLAYLRLVLVFGGTISGEKRTVTAIAYGLTVLTMGISGIVPNIMSVLPYVEFVLTPLFLMLSINFMIFIRIVIYVLSCCTVKLSRRKFSHVVALIGVGLICDSILFVILTIFILFQDYSKSYTFNIAQFFFRHRLVFQSMCVLFRKSTRMHWKKYLMRRRNINNFTHRNYYNGCHVTRV